jgi:4-amino-4-deoxy-L-arabinose transferase-like glycosyltransferase
VRNISAAPYAIACGAVAVFAFVFNWITGHRGIFLLDQSMIFDGAWRVLNGQAPYKDFLIPFGPITFFIQALFFRLFGVNWSATVLAACVLNVLAALSAIRIIRLLTNGRRALALCSGLATAICFQAPFGTLWLEQTAMFFDLLALQAAVESLHASRHWRVACQVASGTLLAIACLSKQNYGLFFVPVVILVMLAGELPDLKQALRSVFLAGTGMAAVAVLFLCWLWLFSDFSSFVQQVFLVGGEIGRSRVTVGAVLDAISLGTVPNRFQVDLIAFVFGCIGLFLAFCDAAGPVWRELGPASACALAMPLFRSFAQISTYNDWQNNMAFVGLSACLGIGIFLSLSVHLANSGRDTAATFPFMPGVRVCLVLLLSVWTALMVFDEARWSLRRTVQQFSKLTTFREIVAVHGLEQVHWGEPTMINETTVLQRTDFERVLAFLAAKKRAFFVMGDSTLFYGLLGVISPQPLLYFQQAHSFRPRDIPRLDLAVHAALEKNNISVVVREKKTFLKEVAEAYREFPITWAWFTNQFTQVAEFGNYEVWERRAERSAER